MRLVCGRGMVSDDTDHAFLVAQVLLNSPSDAAVFQNKLAARLRWWFLGLPAGVGLATARACLKLWLGISPKRSGVASAGNGPAMRSAILGAFFAGNPLQMRKFVTASTRITHTDPRAETAALAVAEAAAWAVGGQHDTHAFLHNLAACGSDNEWLRICRRLAEANNTNETVKDFAGSLGLESGITGYAFHTVPVAIYAWVRHPDDFRKRLSVCWTVVVTPIRQAPLWALSLAPASGRRGFQKSGLIISLNGRAPPPCCAKRPCVWHNKQRKSIRWVRSPTSGLELFSAICFSLPWF